MGLCLQGLNKIGEEVDKVRIGYIGFGSFRREVAKFLGEVFRGKYDELHRSIVLRRDENKQLLDWLDNFYETNKKSEPILDILFLHSDCDGEWNKEEITYLAKWLEEHNPKTNNLFYDKLLLLLKNIEVDKIVFW